MQNQAVRISLEASRDLCLNSDMSACDPRHSSSPPRSVCSPVQTAVQIGCCWGAPLAKASMGTKGWREETNLLLPGSALGGRGSNTSRSQGEMRVRCTTCQVSAWEQPCLWSRIQGHPFPLHCRKMHSMKALGYWAGTGDRWYFCAFTISSSRAACAHARLVAGGCHSSRAGCRRPHGCARKVAAPGSCWLKQGRVAAPGSLATRGNVAASLFSHVVLATPGKPGLWLA